MTHQLDEETMAKLRALFVVDTEVYRYPHPVVFLEVEDDIDFRLAMYEHGPLLLSIAKWQKIIEAIKEYKCYVQNGGRLTCALCHEYWGEGCKGCPVSEHTGAPLCEGSPYDGYACMWANEEIEVILKHAQAELDFLLRLL